MIKLIHLGTGGAHSRHVLEEVKRINRMRECRLSNTPNTRGTYTVVLSDSSNNILTFDALKRILRNESVSFVIGDSNGVPDNIISGADEVYALTSIPTTHQLQALILAESLNNSIMQIKYESQKATV